MSAPEKAVVEGEAEAEAEVDPAAEGICSVPPIAASRSNGIVLDIAIINLTIVLPDPEAERMQIMVGLGTSRDPIIDAVLIQL